MSLANKPRDSEHQFHLFHVDEKWQLLIMRIPFGVSAVPDDWFIMYRERGRGYTFSLLKHI